jgi:excisionase family DNA binding protein
MDDRLYRIIRILIQRALRQILSEELPPLVEKIRTKESKLLTYTEAQVRLNVSKPIFFKILREKRLQTVVLEERTFRIDSIELEEFIERQKK